MFLEQAAYLCSICWYVCKYKLEDAQKDSNSNSTSGLTLSQSKQGENQTRLMMTMTKIERDGEKRKERLGCC